jgi:hypothetical protein
MHNNLIPPAVIAAALSACAVQPELLNSERIEQRFGSYGIEVLEQGASVRRSSLYTTTGSTTTCRTYAVVKFVDAAITDISAAHEDVLAGESIGTTFKTAGWQINKETIYVGELAINDSQHPIVRMMRLEAPATLGLHAYRLMLDKGARSIHYATIIETHHPDYLVVADLLEFYPPDPALRPAITELLALEQLALGSD